MPALRLNSTVWIDRGWQPVQLGFAPTAVAFQKTLAEMGYGPDDGTLWDYPKHFGCATLIAHCKDGTGQPAGIITLDAKVDEYWPSRPWGVAGIIAHEVVHLWRFSLKCMRCDPGQVDEEIEAYAIQHITDQVMQAYACTRGREVKRRMAKATKPKPVKGGYGKPGKGGKKGAC